jgi:hypothetical protein
MKTGLIHRSRHLAAREPAPVAEACGLPLDAEHFDESSIQGLPPRGGEVILARFELPPQYCGIFENFSQFLGNTDGGLLAVVPTPGLQWSVRVNHRPLYPFLKLEHIVNPWGFGGFPVAIRLDENALVELVVARHVNVPPNSQIDTVGGRITGRYWYNPIYGGAHFTAKQFR